MDTNWLKDIHGSALSPGARHLAYELALALADGRHPSDTELAERLGKARRTVIRYREELRRDGFLDWATQRGEVNVYTLKTPAVWAWESPPSTCDTDEPATCDTVGVEGSPASSTGAKIEDPEPVTLRAVEPVTSGPLAADEAGVTCDIEEVVSQVPTGWKRLWQAVSGGSRGDAWHPPKGLDLRPSDLATSKPLEEEPESSSACWLCVDAWATTPDGLCPDCATNAVRATP